MLTTNAAENIAPLKNAARVVIIAGLSQDRQISATI